MANQKRNNPTKLTLSIEHPKAELLSSSLITEVNHDTDGDLLTLVLESNTFIDLRARWNTIMRSLIASEQSLSFSKGLVE